MYLKQSFNLCEDCIWSIRSIIIETYSFSAFVFQIYNNMLDQTFSDYQNAPATLDISALTKPSENKTQSVNDYCRTHATEETKVEMSDSDTVAAEEELLKPSDTEWSVFTESWSNYFIFILKQFM